MLLGDVLKDLAKAGAMEIHEMAIQPKSLSKHREKHGNN